MKMLGVLGTVVALALAACTLADQDSSVSASREGQPSRRSLADFLACIRQATYDYEPAATPAALAEQADAVVTGAIVDVNPGQSYAPLPESEAEIVTSVLEVKVDRVLAGTRAVVADGSVYIEVAHPAFVGRGVSGGPRVPFDHAACAASVPRAYGVFFLADRTNEPYWDTVLNQGAGRPAGARIAATFVQGFLLEDASGGLVSVSEPFETMPPAWHDLRSVDDVLAELR